MAPVKRAGAVAQRETRSTRASTVVKKATSAAKKAVSPISKKSNTVTKGSGAVTRKTRKNVDEDAVDVSSPEVEASEAVEIAEAKPSRGRTIKANATKAVVTKPDNVTRSLAAAPKRRIRITPLDAVAEPLTKDETKASRSKSKTTTVNKKPSTRSHHVDQVVDETHDNVDVPIQDAPESKASDTRPTRKTTAKSHSKDEAQKKVTAKPRGRPKKVEIQKQPQAETERNAAASSTRTTRTRQTGSTLIKQAEAAGDKDSSRLTKPDIAARKKVAFHGLPDENDKENQPIASKSKKSIASKENDQSSARGLRAKPLRKPAIATTTGKERKAATTTGNPSAASNEDQTAGAKKLPRALTPKKITQVAKSKASNEEEDEDMSNGEDELSGNKTPVRDLSISPRRPLNAAIGRAMSPAKRLDFNQSLVMQDIAQDKSAQGQGPHGVLASPARRAPASPFKDALKDSPKRGDSTKLLFPIHNQNQTDVHASLALNPSNIASASQTMSTLLQSPKRTGILDANLFSQSAMKNASTKQSMKTSLLASPAKRLFSPAKKTTTPAMSKISEMLNETQETEQEQEAETAAQSEPESEVTVSSRFRASTSPLRVHRADHDGIDFDDSILQVRSPLKVQQSPVKRISQPVFDEVHEDSEMSDDSDSAASQDMQETPILHTTEANRMVDPSQLERSVDSEVEEPASNKDATGAEHVLDTEDPTTVNQEQENEVDTSSPLSAFTSTPKSVMSVHPNNGLHHNQHQLRDVDARDDTETSEDELAADETPVRSLADRRTGLLANNNHARLSTGVPQSAAGKGFGFTPLAARMTGWQAASPEKTPLPRPTPIQRQGSFEFSPLAGQHVEGEVVITRDSTPTQKLNLRRSLASEPSSRSTTKSRQSLGLRKSIAQRKSLDPSQEQMLNESPRRNEQFEEYMEMRALEEEANAVHDTAMNLEAGSQHDFDFDEVMDVKSPEEEPIDEDETILATDVGTDDLPVPDSPEELTTDLVNFTNASDTAILDFQSLAQEAEGLASSTHRVDDDGENTSILHNKNGEEDSEPETDIALPLAIQVESTEELEALPIDEGFQIVLGHDSIDTTVEGASSPPLQATTSNLDSPSILNIDQSQTESELLEPNPEDMDFSVVNATVSATPARMPVDFSQTRMVNTVVSKVPLRPEGAMSPIRVQRKRARSFGNSEANSNKRISFGNLKELVVPSNDIVQQSPDRRVRTSVAPSPGGTSTPASRYSRSSLGGMSTVTTPGQLSFAIDDFGDSTLDGIELPDEYDQYTELQDDNEQNTPATTGRNFDAESLPATPKTSTDATPSASKNSGRRTTTPATVKKTPVTATKKASTRKSVGVKTERTPLKPVSTGILTGAIVYVDVHTSEGADASGIFIELMTQMGARCVKEWRWNSRSSLASGPDDDDVEQRIGITHVVYKDGGKRTLEKVRDAKGEVLCVGVAWVLDCERQNKWLDEANYAIDTSVLPRGGSKRRKSMEPRALLHNGDGSLSSSRPRRSVSAEMSELMKQDLINTPAKNQSPRNEDHGSDDEEDTELQEQSTPTGFISYDPRTAMTPGTPYLVSQGKQLVQMSAPPKQTGKRLFEDDQEGEEEVEESGVDDSEKVKKDAKRFRMRNLDIKARRRTLGFKPVVGSPLAK